VSTNSGVSGAGGEGGCEYGDGSDSANLMGTSHLNFPNLLRDIQPVGLEVIECDGCCYVNE